MKNNILGHSIALLTIVVWGTTFVSTKVLLNSLAPIEILVYRFFIAYFMLLLIYPKFKKVDSWKDELILFGAGVSGVTLYFLAENVALKYTLASNVGLLVSAAPIITAIMAHIFTKDEKFSKDLIIGLIVAFIGVFFVIFNKGLAIEINPIGDFLALMAAVAWSIYTILLKKLGSKYNYIYLTRKIFFYGLLTSMPILFLDGFKFDIGKFIAPGVLPNMVFLGVVASSMGFVMWNTSINILGAVKVSNYIYLIPFITGLTSFIVLNERITQLTVCGAILILSGVYISERGVEKIISSLKCINIFNQIAKKSQYGIEKKIEPDN